LDFFSFKREVHRRQGIGTKLTYVKKIKKNKKRERALGPVKDRPYKVAVPVTTYFL
jgi:hypothetical protein